MKKNKKISEKFIIEKYLRNLNADKKETFNFKNDAAYLKVPNNNKLVITNDSIVESVDFFKNDSPESIATKITTYNLSDISSMGARPFAYTLSLCLPKYIDSQWLKKFTYRLNYFQKKFDYFLIGGDLSKSNEIMISSNFFGFAQKNNIILRTTAKLNDEIWVTGNLGESAIGLAIRKKRIRLNYEFEKYFLKKYLFPSHFPIGYKIGRFITSAIDISDGLIGDLENLLNDKKFGANIYSSLIPFSLKADQLIKKKIVTFRYLLTSGDDYELLFTANPDKSKKIKNIARDNNIKITKIGRIIAKQGVHIDSKIIKNINNSYQHFS